MGNTLAHAARSQVDTRVEQKSHPNVAQESEERFRHVAEYSSKVDDLDGRDTDKLCIYINMN